MGPGGTGGQEGQDSGRRIPTGRRGVLVCLLVIAAGGWVVGRVLHRRLASQEMLAYETSLAAHTATRIAASRPIFDDHSLPPRTTFGAFLSDQGIDPRKADELIRDVLPVYNLGRVRAGNVVQIARNARGDLLALKYQIDPDRILRITNKDGGFQGRIENVPYQIATVGISGRVQNSLIQAVDDLGEHDQLALQIADIFGWDMDFNTDTQPGDSFAVEVEKKTLHGEFQSYGRIFAAQYRSGSRTFQAVLFHDPEGRPAYYAPSGKSMKKAFLHSPLRFAAHVTSRFSYSRFHPILKRARPHLGIDYGAPVGSAVQAVADGVVESAGWKGEGGKEVKLRHAMGYETYYLHLSQILVKPGERVQQGQLIARTGQTGLATGPHLDFRVTQHGRFRNFLTLSLPPAESVAPGDMDAFVATRTALLAQLSNLATNSASAPQRAGVSGPTADASQGK